MSNKFPVFFLNLFISQHSHFLDTMFLTISESQPIVTSSALFAYLVHFLLSAIPSLPDPKSAGSGEERDRGRVVEGHRDALPVWSGWGRLTFELTVEFEGL